MVQSRDQWLESSGTALASGYHNFVQIKALRGGKWGLADIRKPDDGLRKNVPVLHYYNTIPCSLGYGTGKHLVKVVSGSCVQQPGFKTFRNLIAYHHRYISLEHIYFECSKVAIMKEE